MEKATGRSESIYVKVSGVWVIEGRSRGEEVYVQLTGPGGQRHATPRSSLETPSWPTEFEFKAPAGWRGEISLALFRRRRGVTDLLGHASFPLTDFKSLEDHPVLLTKVKGGGEVRVVVSIFEDQREVEERYELVEKLGVGGTSVVHKAVDKETGQEVAVKVMARGEQSKAEAELMSRLSHPNIVQFHRSHTTRQSEYIVMEVMQGGELYSKVSGCGPLSEHLAALYTHQVLDALAYAHSLGITHGDIKPENILLHSDGLLVKIADFGESTAAASLTPCLYSPPEIVAGGALSHPSDMWSLGVVLFVLLAGYPPFFSEYPEELARLISKGSVDLECGPWASISPNAKDLVQRLLTVDNRSRPTAVECLGHSWFAECGQATAPSPSAGLASDESNSF